MFTMIYSTSVRGYNHLVSNQREGKFVLFKNHEKSLYLVDLVIFSFLPGHDAYSYYICGAYIK